MWRLVLLGVGLASASGVAWAQTPPPQPQKADLTSLSLDELMNLEVTTVSRKPERWWSAPSGIDVVTGEDAPTLEGQYIIKNVVLVTAAILIGATVRGGDLVAEPEIARLATNRLRRSDGQG
jgi:hypothetical protein